MLASERPEEAYVHWTPSTELWDEHVPLDKIQHMSEYLKDVSGPKPFPQRWATLRSIVVPNLA